jgi:hypothetical protein
MPFVALVATRRRVQWAESGTASVCRNESILDAFPLSKSYHIIFACLRTDPTRRDDIPGSCRARISFTYSQHENVHPLIFSNALCQKDYVVAQYLCLRSRSYAELRICIEQAPYGTP